MIKLQELYDFKRILDSYKHSIISNLYRIDDNLIILRIEGINYCLDLNKNSPHVYIMGEVMKSRNYNAPFDSMLNKHFCKATLLSCRLDGMNKILILEASLQNSYKSMHSELHLEFIPRSSNAIITSNGYIVSALRFCKGARTIMPKTAITPMPQPSFHKSLEDRDIEKIAFELRDRYRILQEELVEKRRNALLHSLHSKLKKLESLLDSLPDIRELDEQRERCAMLANYILLHIDEIPSYASKVCIDCVEYDIPVESKISLSSDKLFSMAKKLRQKIANINIQRTNLYEKIRFLRNKIAFAKGASLEQLDIIGQKRNISKKEAKKQYETFYIDGIKVGIGRNEQENVTLLHEAKADFLWLHILNVPSSHLIIYANRVSQHVLHHAGVLLARLCGINDSKVVIDYTKRRFVKIVSGAKVLYSKESKLHLNL